MKQACCHKENLIDNLVIHTHATSTELGECAAERLAREIGAGIAAHGLCYLILATGNSQLPLYAALRQRQDIEWNRVVVFHMDEYLGISAAHPASFRRYMHEQLVDQVPLHAFYGIQGDAADIQAEIERYTQLLHSHPADVCVLGIGENGHLAFNDPPADFNTRELVHVVTLDGVCRQQQVGEGHFAMLADVPVQAISLTVPALLSARTVMAIVPEQRKAEIVRRTLSEPVNPMCPATSLRQHPQAILYLDALSASLSADLLR
ncbi:MAG: glucosamine-6-phosphate deaminase [Chloroflexi bacterium]|nr:glucosamine-6-phosphate deaminase [Chloroflexota bacterium]